MTRTARDVIAEVFRRTGAAEELGRGDEANLGFADDVIEALKDAGFVIVPKDDVRQAMISARSVLHTLSHDKPDDLRKPERASVIAKRIEMLTDAISHVDGKPS